MLQEPLNFGGHSSKSKESNLDYCHDLPDYCSPSSHGSLGTPRQTICPLSEAQKPESTSSKYEPALNDAPTCDSFGPNVSMEEKMEEMSRELDILKATVLWMQGVQDTQNRVISRLLVSQRRNTRVGGSYEARS
ncbi:hypothetical protein QL093DRAFT_1423383 [Fusarium oxysporum]|nr:hypothetical protein QL093DRAFT_1423383 [Fusarium oxysporum]